ncbi:MAG: hypothetical protein WC554_01975 [Clostridia bacterium]
MTEDNQKDVIKNQAKESLNNLSSIFNKIIDNDTSQKIISLSHNLSSSLDRLTTIEQKNDELNKKLDISNANIGTVGNQLQKIMQYVECQNDDLKNILDKINENFNNLDNNQTSLQTNISEYIDNNIKTNKQLLETQNKICEQITELKKITSESVNLQAKVLQTIKPQKTLKNEFYKEQLAKTQKMLTDLVTSFKTGKKD